MADLCTRLAFDDDLFVLAYSHLPSLLAIGASTCAPSCAVVSSQSDRDTRHISSCTCRRGGRWVEDVGRGYIQTRQQDHGAFLGASVGAAISARPANIRQVSSNSPRCSGEVLTPMMNQAAGSMRRPIPSLPFPRLLIAFPSPNHSARRAFKASHNIGLLVLRFWILQSRRLGLRRRDRPPVEPGPDAYSNSVFDRQSAARCQDGWLS